MIKVVLDIEVFPNLVDALECQGEPFYRVLHNLQKFKVEVFWFCSVLVIAVSTSPSVIGVTLHPYCFSM